MISLDGGVWFEPQEENLHLASITGTGIHTIKIRATDGANNHGEDLLNIIIDENDPILTIISPVQQEVLSKPIVEMKWEGDDLTSEVRFSVRLNEGTWLQKGNSTTHVFGHLMEGVNTLELRATDEAGHITIKEVKVLMDTIPPILSIEHEGPFNSFGGIVEMEIITSDSGSGLEMREYSIENEIWESVPRNGIIEISGLSDGEYELLIRITDKAGNIAERKVTIFFDTEISNVIRTIPNGTINEILESIEIEFSKEMIRESITATSDNIDFDITGSGKECRLKPRISMVFGENYEIIIDGMGENGMWMDRFIFTISVSDIVPISGRVVDDEGKALSGAIVTLDNGRYTVTNDDGTFIFNQKMGYYDIYVTLDGYKRGNGNVQALPGNENWVGTIRLQKDERSMGKRVVSFISDPLNLILILLGMLLIIMVFMGFWRYLDRERYADVEIEMDEDI
jgi:hypothetical protein